MENLITTTYVSVWDDGGEIITSCLYNSNTNEVIEVMNTNELVDDEDTLIQEYVLLDNGTKIFNFKMNGETFINGERVEKESIERTKEFITCLDDFKKSYDKLLTVWLSVDTDVIDEFSHLDYPFKDSFNEIDVDTWVKRFKSETSKLI